MRKQSNVDQKTIHEKWEEGGITILPPKDNCDEQILRDISILKLVYKREWFDVSQLRIGSRTVYTITPDGTLVVKEYRGGSRKVHSSTEYKFSSDEYRKLCKKIEDCIENADRQDFYVDDSSEELKIYHKYGRMQIVDRGLGNKNVHIGRVMWEFFNEKI